MGQLRIRVLFGIFAVAGVLSWGGTRLWDSLGTLPSVPLAAPIVLAVIAVVLTATALSLRSRLRAQRERRPGAKGGSDDGGPRRRFRPRERPGRGPGRRDVWRDGRLPARLLDIPARRDQAYYAGFSVLAGIAVIAAAIFLERVCKLPEGPDDDHKGTARA